MDPVLWIAIGIAIAVAVWAGIRARNKDKGPEE